jgi:hypothetical protein
MSKRYNVTQAIEVPGREKPIWHRHGIAFENDQGRIRIKLESLPMPNKDGEVWLSLFEDEKGAQNAPQGASSGFNTGEDIPF